MFGGGISNKTSRLYQALVEKDLAVSISGGLTATIDPYLFEISATVHPDKKANDVIQAIDKEIEKLMSREITTDEIRRAIKQAKALVRLWKRKHHQPGILDGLQQHVRNL